MNRSWYTGREFILFYVEITDQSGFMNNMLFYRESSLTKLTMSPCTFPFKAMSFNPGNVIFFHPPRIRNLIQSFNIVAGLFPFFPMTRTKGRIMVEQRVNWWAARNWEKKCSPGAFFHQPPSLDGRYPSWRILSLHLATGTSNWRHEVVLHSIWWRGS